MLLRWGVCLFNFDRAQFNIIGDIGLKDGEFSFIITEKIIEPNGDDV